MMNADCDARYADSVPTPATAPKGALQKRSVRVLAMRTYLLVWPLFLSLSIATTRTGQSQVGQNGQPYELLSGSSQACSDPRTAGSAECSTTSLGDFGLGAQPAVRNPRTGLDLSTLDANQAAGDASLESAAHNHEQASEEKHTLEPLSEFQKFVAATTGQLLPVYGATYFTNVPSTFAPLDLAPAMPTYVIGPNDELRVRIWGQINFSANLRVDRSGEIYLPQVGPLHVAGLPFSALDEHLRTVLGKYYRNFDLSVDLGRIRSMQVFVAGQARRPGVYTISSLSTLVDALFASGGPSVQGSMRHTQLKRGGENIADFDLYALLIYGDKSKDAQLLPGDVIYIPPAGAQVAIIGSIRNPAIYELGKSETVGDLLSAAGKRTTTAAGGRISLERIDQNQLRQAMELDLDDRGMATTLEDGDIVRVFSILPAYRKTVTLRGNVANPGRFSWHEGMHLTDLIPDRESLLSRDYWWRRSQQGLPVPEFEPFNGLPSIHQPTAPVDLTLLRRQIEGYGHAEKIPQDGSTSDYAGGATRSSMRPDVESSASPLSRQMEDTSTQASRQSSSRQPGSSMPGASDNVIQVVPSINWEYAVIERLNPDTLKTSLIPFDLGKLVLEHDAAQNLSLEPNDTVTIFSQADIRVPLAQQTKYVRLEGEFAHAGIYSVGPGETLHDLVGRAGGLTQSAYLYGSEFTRESTRVLQQQRIEEYARSVEVEIQRGNLALVSSATSSVQDIASASAARASEQDLIGRLQQLRATGRIVLQMKPKSAGIEAIPPIALEDGDRFTVPSVPATINVVGSVYDQNSFLYHQGGIACQYLRLAGGLNRNADKSHVFVIRADGSVVSRTSENRYWGNEFDQLRLYPGDTIVAPEKTVRPTALRGLLDWTQIFSQLAIGAAAVEVLR